MSKAKDRDEFIAAMAREGMSVETARLILRHAATLHRLAEQDCNAGLTPREQRKDAACQARIVELCKPLKIVPRFQGDPRGAVVKLALPSKRGNDFGGEGVWCVP